MSSSQNIDEITREIIDQLQEDGRRSYSAIGKAVGLSEAAVRQRVQKLAQNQVLQIVAVADAGELGYTRQAMIGIQTDDDITGTAQRIAQLPEVNSCVVTSGQADILAEVMCLGDEELLRVVSTIRAIQGVQGTTTYTYLQRVKQEFTRPSA